MTWRESARRLASSIAHWTRRSALLAGRSPYPRARCLAIVAGLATRALQGPDDPGPSQRLHARPTSSLEHVTLTVIPRLARLDLNALGRVPRLRSAYVDVPGKLLARVASACPRLMLTNGLVCFDGGKQTPMQPYYELRGL